MRYRKPGNVYLGVMSRLDGPLTGVVLFARTSKAARRLTEQFRTHVVAARPTGRSLKELARLVAGSASIGSPEMSASGTWRSSVWGPRGPKRPGSRTGGSRRSAAFRSWRSNFGPAVNTRSGCSWPAAAGPSSGTASTAAGVRFLPELHCTRRLAVVHPVQGGVIELQAPLPKSWSAFPL